MTRLSATQHDEIQSQRANEAITRRATVPDLEEILYVPLPVLDQGFVRVIDYMGDDAAIVQAARVSYGAGTKKVSDDRGLIRYLMRHRHTSPFEMCEIKLHVKLPVFIARQWIRHRTANVNEYSARYSVMKSEFYLPAPGDIKAQSAVNRQGSGAAIDPDSAEIVREMIDGHSDQCAELYHDLLNEDDAGNVLDEENEGGIARELARMVLPLNAYTEWYWKIDLHNFLHFSALRADSHAQYEIRAYADVLLDVLKRWAPLTYEAFVDYRKEAVSLSRPAVDVVKQMLKGMTPIRPEGMSTREWNDLRAALEIEGN